MNEGRKEGMKEGRAEGRKDSRKHGRNEPMLFSKTAFWEEAGYLGH